MSALENNQDDSRHGGARKGAGRKAGAATKRTREIANKAAAEGITPLEFLLNVMRDGVSEPRERMAAAIAAAPYVHPRLAAIEHTGEDGGPVKHSLTIEFVGDGSVSQ